MVDDFKLKSVALEMNYDFVQVFVCTRNQIKLSKYF